MCSYMLCSNLVTIKSVSTCSRSVLSIPLPLTLFCYPGTMPIWTTSRVFIITFLMTVQWEYCTGCGETVHSFSLNCLCVWISQIYNCESLFFRLKSKSFFPNVYNHEDPQCKFYPLTLSTPNNIEEQVRLSWHAMSGCPYLYLFTGIPAISCMESWAKIPPNLKMLNKC